MRGLIGDLAIRADGRRLFVTEDADGTGYVLNEFTVAPTGELDLLAAQAQLPCTNTEPGQLALHPTGRSLYVAYRNPATNRVSVGAYFVAGNGGLFATNSDCTGFETLEDLVVDPSGGELRLTGDLVGGGRRVLRYALDPVTGELGALASQDLGSAGELLVTDDPSRASGDPLRQVVYVAIDGSLRPFLRQSDGALAPVAPGLALGFGSAANSFLSVGARRGCVVATSPN